jgi:hypothetical protein
MNILHLIKNHPKISFILLLPYKLGITTMKSFVAKYTRRKKQENHIYLQNIPLLNFENEDSGASLDREDPLSSIPSSIDLSPVIEHSDLYNNIPTKLHTKYDYIQ